MTYVEQLADFAAHARWEDLSGPARQALKVRVLDSLGCALGALDGEPISGLRSELELLGGNPLCTLIGGGRSAPDRAAFFNGALVRYLDFNDSFLAEGETCHPSDCLAPVLAAAEHAGTSGRDLLTALAVAYQVQCRLSEVAPVRDRGFDHTTQAAYAMAAGVCRALRMDAGRTAHAIAIAGTAYNALRVTRTGELSQWKGLAAPNTALGATHAAYLARAGITGPLEVFEGNKGFMSTISGPFFIDWAEQDLELVRRTVLKRFNAEVHAQAAIEAVLELREEHSFDPAQVQRIEVDIFEVAFQIIGGGEEGQKTQVETKEQADHSLPYLLAVALLDGELMPAQYRPERIVRSDVQELLLKVAVRPDPELSRRFPAEHACRVRIVLPDRTLSREKQDYDGYISRPMGWATVASKFEQLASPFVPDRQARLTLIETVESLEQLSTFDLCRALERTRPSPSPHQEQPWQT